MKSSRLEKNQHLNREQVLASFKALGYPLENIVSTVDIGGFAGDEIFRPEALSTALNDVMRKAGYQKNQLILFRVSAERREFVADQGENNHYVALHLIQDGAKIKVTYIDPTGAEISPQVRGVIASNLSSASCTIESSRASLQCTNSIQGRGIPYQMGSNHSDCGVLVALASDMVRGNYEARNQIKLHEASSRQLGQILKQLANGEKALAEVEQVIDGLLRDNVASGEVQAQTYNNSLMELHALERLRAEFDTPEKQQVEVAKRIDEFGCKRLEDTRVTKPHPKPKRPGQTVTETISGAKSEILDILCLAQLLFEGGNEDVASELRVQILQLGIGAKKKGIAYPQKLEYLQKCLAGFKPAIYKTLKAHFAEKFGISEDNVLCLPKATGQQVGAKIVVRDTRNPENPRVFYAKSHQEFCSKSDPIYGMQTSNRLLADLKELFMYKVLEKIGYGPKAEFVVDGDVAQTGLEEGIMIITRDSSYTNQPSLEEKSFKTFGEIKEEIASTPSEEIADETKRDIVAIDILSRVFLLEDVMVNDGNFGMVEVSRKGSGETKTKWKIVDFMPPKSQKGKEHLGEKKYAYTNHYGGSTITYGFTSGNFSHTYAEDSPVNKILSDKRAKELRVSTIASLEDGKSERKSRIEPAVHESFVEIVQFLRKNEESLRLIEADGGIKPLTTRRIQDLEAYRDCTLGNFEELLNALKETSHNPN
jgi:hypothetical protein